MAKSKIAKFKKDRKNPTPAVVQAAVGVAAGFGGYAVNRFLSRIVYSLVLKKRPKLAGHALVGTSALATVLTYFVTRYWQRVSDYHEYASLGSGVAFVQTAVQTYVPRLGWVVSDVRPEQYASAKEMTVEATGGFDLDDLLEGNPDIEAVELGALPEPGEDDLPSWSVGDFDENTAVSADMIN